MTAGYSGTPLIKKLGIKANYRLALLHVPDHYMDLLGKLPDGIIIDHALDESTAEYDFIHAFYIDQTAYQVEFETLKSAIKKNGVIWISWYKKSVKMPTDITEDVVRDVALAGGLVDVKVVAVDDKWSGLKLMYRKADR